MAAVAASDEVPMDHGSEEEDKAGAREVSRAKGAGAEREGVTCERGIAGRKRGRTECPEADRGEDQGGAVRARETAVEVASLERANAERNAEIEERWEEAKGRAWGRLEGEWRKARRWGYQSGTGTSQVWVSTAVQGSGEERDLSGDAMTAEHSAV